MKIGLLTHSVNPRGGVVHTLELAHALHDAGHDVTVMAPTAKEQRFFRDVRCAVELVPLADSNAAKDDMAALVGSRIQAYVDHLAPLLARERFDVLHCHDGIGGNALATLEDRGLVDGFVRTVHHLDAFSQPQLAQWQRRSVERARQVLCVSRLWRENLARDHGIAAHEVPNGVDRARYSAEPDPRDAALARRLGVRRHAPVLLSVGGVEARKNSVRVLQAFIQLRARLPGLQLVVAGGASLLDHATEERAFQALLHEHALSPREVVLTGPLPDEDMPGLFRLADVVLMPSLNEGFGLVVLEALCSGVPVVVSRIAPFTEYLRADDVSWADPFDAASIAEAALAALRGRDPLRIARSAARLAGEFDWGRSAAVHTDLYERLRHREPACP